MNEDKRPIIIDCDTGIDDAVALIILLAADNLDIRGITTVSGNASVENTTRNTCNVCHFLGRDDIRIAAGAEKPLVRKPLKASGVHGLSGLRGVSFESDYNDNLVEEKAWDFMAGILRSSERKVTVLALGPVTNIAILLEKYPDVKEKIDELVFMGTSYHCGNPTAVSTFNVLVDPEAFRKVIFSGLRFVACPLETVNSLSMPRNEVLALADESNYAGTLFRQLIGGYGLANAKENIPEDCEEKITSARIEKARRSGVVFPDPLTAAYLIEPGLFTSRKYYCDVECSGELTTGMTLIDKNDYYM
ncbi:MAG: nucleoside hydrolase, partial [Spirochaetales bacterium]|nr:nucleoside hydrolase [Spirochaetales bacterium]